MPTYLIQSQWTDQGIEISRCLAGRYLRPIDGRFNPCIF